MAISETANGKVTCEVYFVNITLPHSVGFTEWRVTKQELPSNTEVLLGMDVIGCGDFAVTNKDNNTVFSFRCPSIARIDFVAEKKDQEKGTLVKSAEAIGRNWKCPCGSGKRYKNCHGKGVH